MPHLLLALLLAPAADPPPDVAKAVEDRMTRAIALAERGVAAVVVSHRKYDTAPPADKPWMLGGYDPPAFRFNRRFGGQVQDASPLNLANPQAAADNTFGSGLVLTAGGLVLTTHHLIDQATKVYVRLPGGGGSYANIKAADARSDLAVLELIDPPTGLYPVRLADVRTARGPRGEPPTVRRGQWVIAVGHPLAAGFADGAPSASWGILSNLRRRLAAGPAGADNRSRPLASYATLLQTDARLTVGGSGGGLFNLDGETVGLTSSLAGVTGAETAGGYAVPFEPGVRRVVEVLQAGREVEYGFLGVTLTPGWAAERGGGVVLNDVARGMPAEAAGLRQGDVIVGIDDQPVADSDDLFLHVGAALAGTAVRVRHTRPGVAGPREVRVTLAKHKHELPFLASEKRPAVFGLRADYSSVLGVNRDGGLPPGVLIRELDPGSPAEGKLKPLGDVAGGWLVTAVDGRTVPTPAAFEAAAAGKPSVRLTLHDPSAPEKQPEVTLP